MGAAMASVEIATSQLHRCACCTKPIRPGLLMCPRHWRQVPAALQREVNAAWRALRSCGSLRTNVHGHARYERARTDAVAAVQGADESTT
jgi:hypothetical protein